MSTRTAPTDTPSAPPADSPAGKRAKVDDERWLARCDAVVRYKEEHGRLPTKKKNGPKDEAHVLACWLVTQRQALRDGILLPGRRRILDERLPCWLDPAVLRWDETLREVAEFRESFGMLPGQNGRTPRERALQAWLKRQIKHEAEGKLTQAQSAALDLVDGDWRANRINLLWESNLALAILAVQELGAIPDQRCTEGVWIASQRTKLRIGELTEDHAAVMDESIPGWRAPAAGQHAARVRSEDVPVTPSPSAVKAFTADEEHWLVQCEKVALYKSSHGRMPVKNRDLPNSETQALASWLRTQRFALRSGTLNADRRKTLDEGVPGWVDPAVLRWEETLREVAEFRESFGILPGQNGRTPRERALLFWLRRQAAQEAEGRLTAAQSAALDRVDGDWRINKIHLLWESCLTTAIVAVQELGAVPDQSVPAGRWIASQRTRLRTGKLKEDQAAALDESIPGWRTPVIMKRRIRG